MIFTMSPYREQQIEDTEFELYKKNEAVEVQLQVLDAFYSKYISPTPPIPVSIKLKIDFLLLLDNENPEKKIKLKIQFECLNNLAKAGYLIVHEKTDYKKVIHLLSIGSFMGESDEKDYSEDKLAKICDRIYIDMLPDGTETPYNSISNSVVEYSRKICESVFVDPYEITKSKHIYAAFSQFGEVDQIVNDEKMVPLAPLYTLMLNLTREKNLQMEQEALSKKGDSNEQEKNKL